MYASDKQTTKKERGEEHAGSNTRDALSEAQGM